MFRPPLLETLRTKEKEPLLAEPSAKKEPAKTSTNHVTFTIASLRSQ